ncbi:MAG: long-chain fatty acid--CoA ligase [Thermoplasmata archaeon]
MAEAKDRIWVDAWPEGVPETLEYPEMPLYQLLQDTAARVPEHPVTIFYNREMTYGELDALSDKMAVRLQQLGVKKGDRVALFLPNCPQFLISHFGILKAGGTSVPFNPTYVEREIKAQLDDCGARIMIALDLVYEPVHNIRQDSPLERVILTSITDYMPRMLARLAFLKKAQPRQFPGTTRFPHELEAAQGELQPVSIAPREDLALLLYTGGTTGTPKGVMLTHYNQVSNALQGSALSYMGDHGRVLAVIPFFHTYGMTVCMNVAIHNGASIILLPQFHKKDTFKAIQKHRPTHFPGVPTMYVALLSDPSLRKYDLRSLRYCLSGAAPLPQEVARQWEEATGAMIVEGYGLTETSPISHANPMDDWAKVRFGSIGIPIPDTEAKIMDVETGTQEVPIGEIGELVIRGPQVMKGYWNKPDETSLVLRDGWFYTGDIAKMDEDGYFHIVDRKKDMIIVGGQNVYPRDIEEVLFEHEAVEQAAVIGVPDEFKGEVPKAFVTLNEGYKGKVTDGDLLDYLAKNMAEHSLPKTLEFRDELPTTLVGKVLRRELREAAEA